MENTPLIAVISGSGEKYGTGHTKRMGELSDFFLKNNIKSSDFSITSSGDICSLPLEPYSVVIKDTRDGNPRIERFLADKFVFAFDDYYSYHPGLMKYLYTINSLPGITKKGNITEPEFRILNHSLMDNFNKDMEENSIGKINRESLKSGHGSLNEPKKFKLLISFGVHDPFHLMDRSIRFLLFAVIEKYYTHIHSISLVIPQYMRQGPNGDLKPFYEERIKLLKDKLSPYLYYSQINLILSDKEYRDYFLYSDLIITHPGLALSEAQQLGKSFLVVTPTKYHSKIAEIHFSDYFLGMVKSSKSINNKKWETRLKNSMELIIGKHGIGAANILKYGYHCEIFLLEQIREILSVEKPTSFHPFICPFCSSSAGKTISQTREYNLIECRNCGSIVKKNMLIVKQKKREDNSKDKEYFAENYNQRYGKTYEQDRDNIRKLDIKRLKAFEEIGFYDNITGHEFAGYDSGTLRFLDIGCAHGFFLEDLMDFTENRVNKNHSIDYWGVEPNPYACSYIKRDNFHIIEKGFHEFYAACRAGNYSQNIGFDLITAWFVIEHISDINQTFYQLLSLLNPSGYLCFSVPSSNGPSYKLDRKNYIANRPEDHFYDFTYKGIRKILAKHPVKIKKIRIQEHHYQRWAKKNKFLSLIISKKQYNFWARSYGYADTVEVYVQKIQ